MRISIAAFGLIQRALPTSERVWLTQWNAHWQGLNLIGGKKHEDETFRDCSVREVCEELHVTPAQIRVADEPLRRLEFDAWSKRAQAETHYYFEIFDVELDTSALDTIQANPDNAWLTEAEIRAGQSATGRPISSTVLRMLFA